MQVLDLVQGSPEWLAVRAQHFCASDAPAAMGVSKYKQRSELLREKATGYTPEVDEATQRRFDGGHAAEAAARPLVEAHLGEDLFPCVVAEVIDGLPMLASLDGCTMVGDIIWESKQYNDDLAAAVRAGELEPHYWAQLEHELLVSGAEKVWFTTTDGTPERMAGMWYESRPERRAQVIAAWKQFAEDVASYTPAEAPAPAAVGKAPESLPALFIQVKGEVTDSNLAAFKDHALAVFGSINRTLVTDEDFANASKAVTWCGEVESRLAAAKQHALSQTESIDKLFRTIDDISEEARKVRLELDKLVKARKETRRSEILNDHIEAFRTHMACLQKRLGGNFMPVVPVDFAGAMRGLKTFSSMQDKCGVELARGKIAANEIADRIGANLEYLREQNASNFFLFSDTATLVLKDPDDLQALVINRIAAHERVQAAALEQQRARIAEEERVKAEARVRAEQAQIESEERAKVVAVPKAAPAPAAAPTGAVVQMAPRAPAQLPTLRLGKINERLKVCSVTAEQLATLGFPVAGREGATKLYNDADYPRICAALALHIESTCELQAA